MQQLVLYTNLYALDETVADLRRRGKAVRFHPTLGSARLNSRAGDQIVKAALEVPEDADFILYREVERGMVILGQAADFESAYLAARLAPSSGKGHAAAVLTAESKEGRALIHLSTFITTMTICAAELVSA